MCGILAVALPAGRSPDRARIEAMRDTMAHRGPDGAGLHVDGSVALGHRRLSIIDTSPAGQQPMPNEDETVWLVFNGEIYNYVELTQDLKRRGHQFRSATDSEVILHLWEEYGERCVDHLNGMFAFVIWDSRKQELFAARDRAGIKPLQYYHGPDRFIAASEIKAILADPEVPVQPDYQGLSDCLLTGYPFHGSTCFAGIRQLQPGCALSLRDGKLRTWRYWQLDFVYDRERSVEQSVEQLYALLDDAIRIHCRSDAPLGAHLSGGLDSSSIAAFTTRHRQPLHTFSIRFAGGSFFDEGQYARLAAGALNTRHHEAHPGVDDLIAMLARLAWHCDMPMPDVSSFSYYSAARLAGDHVRVAMTGHGGDEIFAGYPAQFAATFGDTSMFDLSNRPTTHVPFLTRARTVLRHRGIRGTLSRLLGGDPARKPEDLGQRWLRLHGGIAPQENPMYTSNFRRQLGSYDSRIRYLDPLFKANTDETLDRCLYHDLTSYLPGLLHQEDRASMSVSLESRVPLLDYRLVEFMATVPPEQKVVGREPKALLRRAVRGMVPDEIVNRRDKGPFGVPINHWFQGPLVPTLREYGLSQRAQERGIFEPSEVKSQWHNPSAAWQIVAFELWFRIFIDRDRDLLDRIAATAPTRAVGV
jgi:asparagine synthase (glutamine-hydrolysing)